jgi:hypothetical protein
MKTHALKQRHPFHIVALPGDYLGYPCDAQVGESCHASTPTTITVGPTSIGCGL